MVDAIDAWVDVIFFAVAAASSATAPAELKFRAKLGPRRHKRDCGHQFLLDNPLGVNDLEYPELPRSMIKRLAAFLTWLKGSTGRHSASPTMALA
jgi:hypothetical protein